MIIQNCEELLAHGNVEGRRVALQIIEAGLAAADPYENVKSLIRVEGRKLIVGNERIKPADMPGLPPPPTPRPRTGEPLVFDLDQVGHIYVSGGGKAAQSQAKAIEDVLGDLITEGHICAKKGDQVYLKRIGVTLAGHPMPDEDSVAGASKVLAIERKARKGDIIFLSESGGGSALMALPAPGISLRDLQEVYRILYFGCGAPMPVANAVRNLLTLVRGRHTRNAGEATLIHIATSETPPGVRVHLNDRPHGVNAYAHATNILRRYGCWDQMPESVRQFILRADPQYEPPRPEEWYHYPRHYFGVMGPHYMLAAARQKAQELGLDARILVSSLSDIEAQPAAEMLAYIAQEVETFDRPFAAPCVLLCGGEVVVAVGDKAGYGGRNMEFALATAARLAGSRRIVIASVDSDGADGPTDVAGAIVDGTTWERAVAARMDIAAALAHHDTYPVFKALGDAVFTGVQRSNLRDLRLVYIG